MEMNYKLYLPHYGKMTYAHDVLDIGSVAQDCDHFQVIRGTGILDKHGIEIFEGNVLRGDNYPFMDEGKENYVAVMEWIFNSWQIVAYKHPDSQVRGISDGVNMHVEVEQLNHFEIIGHVLTSPKFKGIND